MAKKEKKDRIQLEPISGHKGSIKYTNPDWGTISISCILNF